VLSFDRSFLVGQGVLFRTGEEGSPSSFGQGPSNRTPDDRRRRPSAPPVGRIVVWVLGLGGYIGLLLAAHGSRHADDLRGLAIVWLIVFGGLNAHLILNRR